MFTQFDIIVSFITLLFLTMGFFKGAIRSILGLGKWYGAGVLTLLLYPQARELVSQYIQPGMIVNGVAVILTYIVALIALSIIIGIFVAALGGTVGGAGDKVLGAAVGITIGVIIASTAHYFVRSFGGGVDPSWLKSGATYEITSNGADKLQGYFKDVVNKMGVDMGMAASIDPTGGIVDKIKDFQSSTGSTVDLDKLKEAVRLMKEEGMAPDQIKDMINIQDYMSVSDTGNGSVNSDQAIKGITDIMKGDASGLSKINSSIGGKSGGGTGVVDDDYYGNLRTYKGPGSSSGSSTGDE